MAILAAVSLGIWMHLAVEELAAGDKLLLARALIWGSLAGVCSILLAWRPISGFLLRLAARAEQSGRPSLWRGDKAGRAERALAGLFLALCASLTAVALLEPATFVLLFSEDGPFETATAILYGISAISCVALAIRARGHRGLRISLIGLALLFLVVGGEEVSWGQRLLGFGTPETLAAINVQEEFTLHNIYSISIFTYPALATTALLLFVAPLLQSRSAVARRVFHAYELPVAPLACSGLYGVMIGAYLVVGLSLGTPTPLPISYSAYVPHFDDEMLEFLISALFTVFALSDWRLRLPGDARSARRESSAPLAA